MALMTTNKISATPGDPSNVQSVSLGGRDFPTLSASDPMKGRLHKSIIRVDDTSIHETEAGPSHVKGIATGGDGRAGSSKVTPKTICRKIDVSFAKSRDKRTSKHFPSSEAKLKGEEDNDARRGNTYTERRLYSIDPPTSNGGQQFIMLVAIVTMLIALLLGVTCYYLSDSVATRNNILKDRDVVLRSAKLGDLEHALQMERDQSVHYLSVMSPNTKTFLMECYGVTDTILRDIPWPDNLDRNDRPEYATKISFQMYLKQHRKMLDILGNTIFEEMDFYAEPIKTLMQWLNDVLSQSRHSNMWKSLVAYEYMISAKELAATERTLGGYFFSNGGFDNMEQYSLFIKQINVFQSRYSTARGYSKIVPPLAISSIPIGEEDLSTVIDRYRDQIKYIDLNETSLFLAFDWFDMMSMYMSHLFDVQKQIEGALIWGIDDMANKILVPIIASNCIFGILSIAYPLLLRVLWRNTKNFEKFSLILKKKNRELAVEKKRTEQVLRQSLPRYVADELRSNRGHSADYYESVTILFTNISGFTRNIPLSGDPNKMVTLLNDIDALLEAIIKRHNVYKMVTIGEAYMITSGLPERNSDHFCEIADFALDLMATCSDLVVPDMPTGKLSLRIGIHSGPVVAGVVSATTLRYCVFGPTTQIAATMESQGIADEIQISLDTYELLASTGLYEMAARTFEKTAKVKPFHAYLLLGSTRLHIIKFGRTGQVLPGSFSSCSDNARARASVSDAYCLNRAAIATEQAVVTENEDITEIVAITIDQHAEHPEVV